MTDVEQDAARQVLVNWYCTRRHYADREGETSRFLCGSGYGFPEYRFEEWGRESVSNRGTKVWDKIPMCKTCLRMLTPKPTMTPEQYVYAIVEIIADFDLGGEVFWHRGRGFMQPVDADGKRIAEKAPLVGAVLCNDLFWWATSDLEDIGEDDIQPLRATLEEVGDMYGGLLWVARKRGMRPQMAYLNRHGHEKDFPMEQFLAAGPERTREDEG